MKIKTVMAKYFIPNFKSFKISNGMRLDLSS